ncbi:MAG TPA: WecB/TagA/CpsF family glycosyltransferase [Tepidisphaeraceae bacterium]|jgi:N-acetylglucosaminyldiphosphoundecaprenol N-acetyl-beta-D-mannosaminyltransferase|nr:WecB/TagA/CpsF family glycosyltransferase [Tepidisphaeraceae bacterium]
MERNVNTNLNAPPARCDVLGVGISAVNMASALATIARWVERRSKHYVCVTGVHGVIESQSDPALKAIHNAAGMVTPDGMPMVWLNRLAGNKHVQRVYGPDLMLAVCAATGVKGGARHFFYGGGEGVADLLAEKLREQFPRLQIAGTYCPPFRKLTAEEDRQIVETIDRSQADIVWVGLSTPKQEHWMSAHIGRIAAPVMIGVGAAFDFHAGLKSQAPHWMQRIGMEWFFRLITEPRRLWKRYLRNNPLFVWYVLLQRLGLMSFGPLEMGEPRQLRAN